MNETIKCKEAPLVIITTNNERELPPAFLRRCVELDLKKPELNQVANAHFGKRDNPLISEVFNLLDEKEREVISPAEFIDTIRACIELEINLDSDIWDILKQVTVMKRSRRLGDSI